jgi:hypothetical protein
MGFLFSWGMKEIAVENSDLALLGGVSLKAWRNGALKWLQSIAKNAIFRGPGEPPADTRHSAHAKPGRVEDQELSVAYFILFSSDLICAAVRRSMIHMVP